MDAVTSTSREAHMSATTLQNVLFGLLVCFVRVFVLFLFVFYHNNCLHILEICLEILTLVANRPLKATQLTCVCVCVCVCVCARARVCVHVCV